MSQSSLFIDIGNSAVKWRTCDSEVFTEAVDLFSLELLPKADSVWVSAVAHLNIVQATQSVGSGEMAFGWQAGSGDGYLRVFNATTSGDQGTAWFGYSPHETETVSELLTIDRMICNWAGVGSQRSGQQFLQMQEMQLAEGIWAPTQSKISYAPTNSCSMDEADQEDVFPTVDWDITQHDLAPMSDYTFSVPRL